MRRKIFIILVLVITAIQIDANALKYQESPYLQQHADNPVDWMPWSKEAFAKAKKEKKMIFLSIGYSTCHWCHVMEEESFENKKLAKYLNNYFVPIKVDREEMPQIDSYYQKVYQVMNGRGGGWPLTILMTADKKVFFSGTFIPLEARYGSMGLWDLLKKVVTLQKKNPQKLTDIAKSVESLMKQVERVGQQQIGSLKGSQLEQTFVKDVAQGFDSQNGGIGNAPKFPQASTIIALLNIYSVNHSKRTLSMATSMLEHMAKGGIYDQIEGGFYRYSTDAQWKIPHFEKMLYTNAELLEAYALAFNITHKKLYKKVIDERIALLKEKYQYKGLYYGASDADSLDEHGKKEEGYYYVFSHKEALEALKKAKVAQSEKILEYLGISWEGNF
ncbi:MAG TPA: thioredoxin domain-containing protein, partial [Nitratifractor sp.]|nr:thioredoxin domain-containing protein [Nitratifractor sp.]